jgi:hypothetical protein
MAPSITDLAFTNNMSLTRQPFLTDFEASLTSIQDHINDKVANNLVQLAKDCMGTPYAFDDDGNAQFSTHSLYDKQTVLDSYTGGDFTISTTGAWTDIDASNASIAVTPEIYAGDFKVSFDFHVSMVTTNATNLCLVQFRLTDGSENSTFIAKVHRVTGVTATTEVFPIHLAHEFDAWSVAAKTVKLQYYITTLTATTLKVLSNSNAPIYMQAEKI